MGGSVVVRAFLPPPDGGIRAQDDFETGAAEKSRRTIFCQVSRVELSGLPSGPGSVRAVFRRSWGHFAVWVVEVGRVLRMGVALRVLVCYLAYRLAMISYASFAALMLSRSWTSRIIILTAFDQRSAIPL